MPNSGGGTTSTSKSEPWEGQKPYLEQGYKEAQGLYDKGPAQYYPGSTVAGFGPQSENALNAIYSQGMNGQQQRAASQNALDQFAGGGLGDWNNYGDMRNLGLNNSYANNPATSRLADMSMSNQYQNNPAYNELSRLNAGNGMNLSGNLYGRIGDITQTGGNIAGRADNQLGTLLNNGGNVAGYSQGAVGDITAQGAGSNSQIRNDTYDLITGQAQAANPGFGALSSAANGNFLGANPFIDDTYARAASGLTRQFAEGVAPGIDSAASRAGRYGSGMHANTKDAAGESFGRTLGDLATSIYGGNYATERQNQLSAANTLGSQYLQGQDLRARTASQSAAQAAEDARLRLGATSQVAGDMSGDAARKMQAVGMSTDAASQDLARRMQASQQMTGAEQQDWQNLIGNLDRQSQMYDTGAQRQLQANDQLSRAYESGADRQINALNSSANIYNQNRGQQLQALQMQPAYQAMGYTDLNAASAAGGQRDQMGQQYLNSDIARHDFNQNAPWQQLQRYLASIQGGNPGGTTSVTQSGGNPLASLFAGLGGAGQLAMGTRGLLW